MKHIKLFEEFVNKIKSDLFPEYDLGLEGSPVIVKTDLK